MNGWYWNYHVRRILTSALGYQNQRIFGEICKYKRDHQGDRHGKSLPDIVAMENDRIYPMVRGIEGDYPDLEQGITKLSDSGNLHNALSHSLAAFVVVKGRSIEAAVGKKQKRVPVTDLRFGTQTLQNYFINFENPPPEILQSFVGKPREKFGRQWPSRVLFNIDMEIHTPYAKAADDDLSLFNRLEPARKILEDALLSYGIPHTCIMTGRGYHFVTQVMGSSIFMDHLVDAGWKIEDSVKGMLDSNEMQDKLGFRMPHSAECAYKAITRLQQYLITKVIRRIRHAGQRVEISDRGGDCVVLDNTSQLRTSHSGNVAVVASPYEKFYENGGRIMARLNRSHNRREWIFINDGHHKRRYMDSTLRYLKHCVGYIPEGSDGLSRLLWDYKQSSLFNHLHNPMDHVHPEPPHTWGYTYRAHDYHYLKQWGIDVWQWTHDRNPVQNLLNPEILNGFIFALDRHGWHPRHIAGLLRSIYEDSRFNWGGFFFADNAERHANGWVEIILGQKYES